MLTNLLNQSLRDGGVNGHQKLTHFGHQKLTHPRESAAEIFTAKASPAPRPDPCV